MRRAAKKPLIPLPRSSPRELLRVLVPPAQAIELVLLGTTADALANATRGFGKLRDDGLDHLVCHDILDALAELDLRTKELSRAAIQRVAETRAEIDKAEAALDAAKSAHACAKAEIFRALGYDLVEKATP